ncbi:hypothetical protein AVEN_56821-1, partial [Araneus ventricosus]
MWLNNPLVKSKVSITIVPKQQQEEDDLPITYSKGEGQKLGPFLVTKQIGVRGQSSGGLELRDDPTSAMYDLKKESRGLE